MLRKKSPNGATAAASSTYGSGYPASAAINGDRKGLNWNSGGGWNDATAGCGVAGMLAPQGAVEECSAMLM